MTTYSFRTALDQGNTAYIPTLTPPLQKKQQQCTAKQLQLRALRNLKFSQVSGFYVVKKTQQNKTKQQHKT